MPKTRHPISRRRFLAGAASALALGYPASVLAKKPKKRDGLPAPQTSEIDHVVVVMMENRSFDHYLGWLPGADGKQAGLTYLDRDDNPHSTYELAPEFQGCGHSDPDHSFQGGRDELNGGACDGWLKAGANDEFAIGYYVKRDLPFLGPAAEYWTTGDRYFCSIMAPTFPNRFYQHSAQTDRLDNTAEISTLPTIWDLLANAGVEGRYYFSDVPFLGLWGAKYLGIGRTYAQFLVDCALGTLPAVSFVEPRFLSAELGTSGDDHPFADIRVGQAFLNEVYEAVTRGPAWKRTLFVINYDEWGGFFEHVPPPIRPVPPADEAVGNDGLLGFRVPFVLVSPLAQRRHVSHAVLEHTSILRLIEWRWGLPPLTIRDKKATNLATLLNFTQPALEAPGFAVPPPPLPEICLPLSSARTAELQRPDWEAVAAVAAAHGWPIGG